LDPLVRATSIPSPSALRRSSTRDGDGGREPAAETKDDASPMTDAADRHGQPAGRARRTPEAVIGIRGGDGPIRVTLTGLAIEEKRDVSGDSSGRPSATDRGYREETNDGSYFAPLAKARNLLLTTFRPTDTPVSAPVQGIVAATGPTSGSGADRARSSVSGIPTGYR